MPIRQYADDDLYTPPKPRTIASIGNNAALQPNAYAPPILGSATPQPTQSSSISTDPIARIAGQIPAAQSRIAPAALSGDPRSLEARVAQDGLTLGLLGPLADRSSTTPQRATIGAIATTPPGTRAQNTPQATPSAGPAAVDNSNAPIGTDPNSELLLNRQLAGPKKAAGSNLVSRGNAGIAALARDPTAFNDVNTANGTGISATSSNGKLTIDGVAASRPQPFTQGIDLAGANARMRASLDQGYADDRRAQLADLADQLKNSNAPPGSARAAAITNQIQALSGIQREGDIASSRAGLEKAQGGLATAQAAETNQKTKASADMQKQLAGLSDAYVNEQDPVKRKAIGEQMLTMKGIDVKNGQYQIAMVDKLVDPMRPEFGLRKEPYIIDQRSGTFRSVLDAAGKGDYPEPLPQHIANLKANPSTAADFDAKYGPGAAKKVLGK